MSDKKLGFPQHFFQKPNDSDIIWVTDFNSEAVIAFYEKFIELEQRNDIQVIPVFINSYGGEIYALTAMRDLIKSSPKPVATVGVGMAMSCGASLLAAGTKGFRFASENTHIMIHQVSGVAPGKSADILEYASVISELNNGIISMLSSDSGSPITKLEKEIKKRNNADWTLSAQEAKKWGFIDSVGIPRSWTPPSPHTELITVPTYAQLAAKKGLKPQKS